MSRSNRPDAYNGATMTWVAIVYTAILVVFGYQTWEFLMFLFPHQNALAQVFGIGSFDVMAFSWAVIFHKRSFYSRNAKMLVGFAWAVTFALSTLASVLYMSITNVVDINMKLPVSILQMGDFVVIAATVFNLLCLTFFFKWETEAANPHKDMFEHYEALHGTLDNLQPHAQPYTAITPAYSAPTGYLQPPAQPYTATTLQPASGVQPPASGVQPHASDVQPPASGVQPHASDVQHTATTPQLQPTTLQQIGEMAAPVSGGLNATVKPTVAANFEGTPEQVKRLKRDMARRLKSDGYTIRRIAETVGVSESTVHNWLRRK